MPWVAFPIGRVRRSGLFIELYSVKGVSRFSHGASRREWILEACSRVRKLGVAFPYISERLQTNPNSREEKWIVETGYSSILLFANPGNRK